MRIICICLFLLCISTTSSRAELQLLPKMQSTCAPSNPASYMILRWTPRNTFVSRLTCTNGKSFELASNVHPATTTVQMAFSNWMPWSFLLYLLPFVIVIGVATIGSEGAMLLMTVNAFFATYAISTAWLYYASITGNPRDEWLWLKQLMFLNPYAFGGFLIAFLIVNVVPIWRLLDGLFYRHPHGTVLAPVWPTYQSGGMSLNAPLMPNIHEFFDPRETTSYYQRETDRLRAFKEKLDAETAFAHAYLRRERTRNHLNNGY